MATGYADLLTGNNLANELRGEAGNDAIWGNGGADVINGGIGDDAIAGGTGADTMIGGSGNDHIWGGGGNDRFEFASNWGDDWVWDFQAGSDKLYLSQVGGLNNLIQLDIDVESWDLRHRFGAGQTIARVRGAKPSHECGRTVL